MAGKARLKWIACLLDPGERDAVLARVKADGHWMPLFSDPVTLRRGGELQPEELELHWFSAKNEERPPAEPSKRIYQVPSDELDAHSREFESLGWELVGARPDEDAEGWHFVIWRTALMTAIEAGEIIPIPWDEQWERFYETSLRQGFDAYAAETVAEGTVREGQAAESGGKVRYEDVERELEDLYRSVGAAPGGIEKAKAKVRAAAERGALTRNDPIELALFYCYRESLRMHREFLATQTTTFPSALGRGNLVGSGGGPSGFIFIDDPSDGFL